MSEPTQPSAEPPAAEPIAPTPEPSSPPPASDAPITAREAAGLISGQPDQASADKADAAPPKEPSGETDGDDPSTKPIDAPRSWTKADKEAFASLPRDTQERILALDRTRELELRRGQNEAAEQRKAAEALAQQAEQAQAQVRAAYERSLPEELLVMKARYREEFGIPTEAEIAEWELTDPAKAVRWNGMYQRITRAQREVDALQYQQQQQQWQQQQKFQQHAEAWKAEETQKFLEKAPEWKDQATYEKKVAAIMNYLENEIGFEREFLERAASEFLPIQIHDHKFQLLAWKGHLYDEAMKAAKQPARASVPPVQRPGVPPQRGEANEARFRDLNRQLDRSGNARDAARLIAAMNGR